MKPDWVTIHDFQQGSPEWHEHRKQGGNASRAAEMLGIGLHGTRNDLAESEPQPIDRWTQQRFDQGLALEQTARTIAESIVGDELYPVVLSGVIDGVFLSASLDGITFDHSITWEHKTGNKKLMASLADGVIPEAYHPQMEQGLLLSGAEKCLFMASTDYGPCLYAWYTSRPELRAMLVHGWKQFQEGKLAVSPEPSPVTIDPIMGLPVLSVRVESKLLSSNLALFREGVIGFVEGIKTILETDSDYLNAENQIKFCKDSESRIDLVKKELHSPSIDELFRTLDFLKEILRQKRLLLEKLVKTEKERRRQEIAKQHYAELQAYCRSLTDAVDWVYHYPVKLLLDAMKGLKTLKSCENAAIAEVTRLSMDATASMDAIRLRLERVKGHEFLFPNLERDLFRADFQELLTQRLDAHLAPAVEETHDSGTALPTASPRQVVVRSAAELVASKLWVSKSAREWAKILRDEGFCFGMPERIKLADFLESQLGDNNEH